MGSGKSTLGKKLAQKLNRAFFDLDAEVEKQEGSTVQELFNTKGENHFRETEHKLLKQLLNHPAKYVMALGGGTPCFYNNMELINKSGTSIYIKYNSGILASRLCNAKADRPLVKGKNEEELRSFIDQLLFERESYYNQCNIVVEKFNLSVDDLILFFQ